jgi:hypothetical protein
MNLFLLFISSASAYLFPMFTKPCTNCKYFLNLNNGKCLKFPINYLVTENISSPIFLCEKYIPKHSKIDYFSCYVTRSCDYLCGKDGKYYERK